MLTFIEAHWAEILATTAALWLFYKSEYWPYISRRREQVYADNVEAARDDREHLQQSQTNALEEVLSVNRQLIDHLLSLSNGKFDGIVKDINLIKTDFDRELSRLEAHVKGLADNNRIVISDWAAIVEYHKKITQTLDDIEQWSMSINGELNDIKDKLK